MLGALLRRKTYVTNVSNHGSQDTLVPSYVQFADKLTTVCFVNTNSNFDRDGVAELHDSTVPVGTSAIPDRKDNTNPSQEDVPTRTNHVVFNNEEIVLHHVPFHTVDRRPNLAVLRITKENDN